jgi:peptidoglycan hydrolase FlgJ
MASIPQAPLQGLALENRSLDALRLRSGGEAKAAMGVARPFEALFTNELLKSMRAPVPHCGPLDDGDGDGGAGAGVGAGSRLGTEWRDAPFAGQTTARPDDLSDVIMKQLERQMGLSPGPIPVTGTANNTAAPLQARPPATRIPQAGALGFVQQHTEAAQRAEAVTGIPATFMVSQAALETGWGRKEIRHADGTPSFNLFGIKAGGSWKGPVAEITTTEFVNGKAQKVVAKFRAYGSYAESFADYGRLMKESPRYQAAMSGVTRAAAAEAAGRTVAQADTAADFARGLQKAGYATDPDYADKLTRVINTTLRLQRTTA